MPTERLGALARVDRRLMLMIVFLVVYVAALFFTQALQQDAYKGLGNRYDSVSIITHTSSIRNESGIR